jgi:hypothetical protein
LKKYPYTVVRWPEDRNGLLFGIVQSAFISNKIREVGEVIGTCTVCSGFKRIPNVKFHFKGTREECLERFSVLSDCYRQYFNDSSKTTRSDVKGHNHKPDFSKLERIEYLKLIKENATKDISADPRTVIDNAPVLSVEAAAKVTCVKNLIQSIHYARDKGQQRLPTANTRKDLIITDYFRITLSGMLFLFADTGSSDPNRILLFATLANIALMNEFSNW